MSHEAVGPCGLRGCVYGPCWPRIVLEKGPCRLRGHVGRVASRVLFAKGLFLWAVLSNIYMVISPV